MAMVQCPWHGATRHSTHALASPGGQDHHNSGIGRKKTKKEERRKKKEKEERKSEKKMTITFYPREERQPSPALALRGMNEGMNDE